MKDIKVGDCLICTNEYNYINHSIHIGEKCTVVKVSTENISTYTFITVVIRYNNRDFFFSLDRACNFFETVSEHRKRVIEELI